MARRRSARPFRFTAPRIAPFFAAVLRRLPGWVAGAAPLVVVAVGFTLGGRAEAFRVREVRWPAGASLRQALPPVAGQPIFAVDLQEVQRSLEAANPGFREIRVSRVLPSTLLIETWERRPLAQVRLGKYYPIDEHGFILKDGEAKPLQALPLLEGVDSAGARLVPGQTSRSARLQAALALCERLHRERWLSGHALTSLDMRDPRRLSCVLDGTIETKLGALEQLDQTLPRLRMVLSSVDARQMARPKSIDVRFTDPVIVPE